MIMEISFSVDTGGTEAVFSLLRSVLESNWDLKSFGTNLGQFRNEIDLSVHEANSIGSSHMKTSHPIPSVLHHQGRHLYKVEALWPETPGNGSENESAILLIFGEDDLVRGEGCTEIEYSEEDN
ncbi:MAG: hypothetical protein H5U10_13195 [Desulfacinum sp.]|jgi:hypothetical protein|nr:hypothetical protein [Desulfacinum sp.]